MPDLVTGQVFQDGEKGITATKLNNIVASSVIQPVFYTGKPASPTLDPTDLLLELKGTNTYANITGSQLVSSVATQVTQVPGFITGVASQVTLVNGFISKSAAYTLTTADNNKYVVCSGGSWTLTLPTAALGLYFQLRNDQTCFGVTGTITLQPPVGGATIDGKTSLALLPCQECALVCDGTNWRSFGLKREVILGTQDITSGTVSAFVLLPAGFRLFELDFTSVLATVDGAILRGFFSIDGGSNWITSTNYGYQAIYNSSPSAAAAIGSGAYSGVYIGLICPAVNAEAQTKLKIYPGSASLRPTWLADSGGYSLSNSLQKINVFGVLGLNGLVNAFQYSFPTGNIAQSFLTVKGVV